MFDRIVSDPDILGGKPVIRGTRISVEFTLELVASGGSVADLVTADPFLTPADLRKAPLFDAGSLKNDVDLTAGVAWTSATSPSRPTRTPTPTWLPSCGQRGWIVAVTLRGAVGTSAA